jgi:hypothetical protein
MYYSSRLAHFKIKLILIIWLGFYTQVSFAQTLFQSVQEVGTKNIVPSATLKQKVAKISNRPIGTEKGEMNGIFDQDFYELKNGFISYGPEVSYMYYRLIFDKQENWLETQELFHGDVLPEDEYYQVIAKMRTALKKKYLIGGWRELHQSYQFQRLLVRNQSSYFVQKIKKCYPYF